VARAKTTEARGQKASGRTRSRRENSLSERRYHEHKPIASLRATEGAPPRAPTGIANRMADGWKATFPQPARPPRPARYDCLRTPALHHADADALGAPFALAEIQASLKRCKRSKSGGPDMLPNAWYRAHAETLAPILLTLFGACFSAGVVPPSFIQATVVCLPKGTMSTDPSAFV
jgi:hypothetical protein